MKLFFLPGYSPELNPDEWVWKNVKHDRIAKTGVTSKDDLKTKATTALRRLHKLPHLVRAISRTEFGLHHRLTRLNYELLSKSAAAGRLG